MMKTLLITLGFLFAGTASRAQESSRSTRLYYDIISDNVLSVTADSATGPLIIVMRLHDSAMVAFNAKPRAIDAWSRAAHKTLAATAPLATDEERRWSSSPLTGTNGATLTVNLAMTAGTRQCWLHLARSHHRSEFDVPMRCADADDLVSVIGRAAHYLAPK